jgi:hypothetical protein
VLTCWGASRDRRDKRQWPTTAGPLSVTGSKFINWHHEVGGGGAIDLVMHLGAMDFLQAVVWLETHFPSHTALHAAVHSAGGPTAFPSPSKQPASRVLVLPVPDQHKLEQVRRYLMEQRCLEASILEPLLTKKKIYADQRGNAVFLMVVGKENRPIGAELRGTGRQVWRGMAPGSRKDLGYFWVGDRIRSTIVLCESAIDAISCFQRRRDCICISTAGVRANPSWLSGLIARGFEIHCGFDADPPGDRAAHAMMSQHNSVQRLRPPVHDWNDALRDSAR